MLTFLHADLSDPGPWKAHAPSSCSAALPWLQTSPARPVKGCLSQANPHSPREMGNTSPSMPPSLQSTATVTVGCSLIPVQNPHEANLGISVHLSLTGVMSHLGRKHTDKRNHGSSNTQQLQQPQRARAGRAASPWPSSEPCSESGAGRQQQWLHLLWQALGTTGERQTIV